MSKRIDESINERLKQERISASGQADDAEFLRRVYLDLNGRVPSVDETISFLESNDPHKRASPE